MRNPSTSRHRREDNSPAVAPSPETVLAPVADRAELAQPRGYHPGRITEPPAVLLDAADTIGAIALVADMAADPDCTEALHDRIMAAIGQESRRLSGVLRSVAAGAALAALLAVGIVLAPAGAPHAAADVLWTAPTVQVTLDRVSVHFTVPVVVDRPNPWGVYAASVWLPRQGRLILAGWASSRTSAALSVPVVVDGRAFPAGRSVVYVQDDATGSRWPVTVEALRPSRIAGSYVADGLAGRVFVAALVQHYSPAAGGWIASQLSPVRVQVLHGRTWRTVGTVTTDARGYAAGYVATGTGRWPVRLVRPQGATVGAAVGPVTAVTVTSQAVDLE